ncbi:Peroxisomal 2,4-dienoyl-CoA reductase [Capsicum baccatum]|uniref:2,4-dienoyl-CoA reductase [(3E)-enoyl-CoA-producing] n=1 Tax=Capsicum baccatum TaxID=33114 RepID=A0A2G2XCP2_CAPBA|nr:Peroxisomal 2,4-dienoyl-CoA reductase [Capsicum baccatum]
MIRESIDCYDNQSIWESASLRYNRYDNNQLIRELASLRYNLYTDNQPIRATVDAVTRNLALEWGTDYDIKVNSIAQGSIGDTAGMHKLGLEEISNKSREYMFLYKLGEKYDIAMAALYLASDASW